VQHTGDADLLRDVACEISVLRGQRAPCCSEPGPCTESQAAVIGADRKLSEILAPLYKGKAAKEIPHMFATATKPPACVGKQE
jgi:hypothetical protein